MTTYNEGAVNAYGRWRPKDLALVKLPLVLRMAWSHLFRACPPMQIFSDSEICSEHLPSHDGASVVAKRLAELTDQGLAISCSLPNTGLLGTTLGGFCFLLVLHCHF